MKKLLSILLLTSCFLCGAQTQSQAKNTSKGIGSKKYSHPTINSSYPVPQDTCLDKQFSVVFYIVLDSTTAVQPNYPGVGFATSSTLALIIDQLNAAFKPICVSFVNCSTVFIPNFTYGNTWKKSITEATVTASYYTENTINFFLVDEVDPGFTNTEAEGYTYPPPPAVPAPGYRKDIIVLDKAKTLQPNGGAMLHLVGHFFGLPHTHDEINPTPTPAPPVGVASQELADGSNCGGPIPLPHGDGFCDTEADPGNNLVVMDSQGNYYTHPLDNFMSYYSQRSRFTQEQYNHMAKVIRDIRKYLH